jgi:hypothetical protein
MTEAFDPNSYRHEHGPNETCDVCALLAEIQRLSAELKVTRIGWDTTQGMLTWVVGEREADLKREYHKCALFNCRNRALPSFCEVHSDVPRDIIDLLSVAETAFRGGFKPPVWWRDAALRFINGEPRQVCNWYENGAMCNGLPMPGTGRCERHTHEPRTLPEVAGDSLPTTLAQFELRAKHYLADEQAKISPDTALIGLLCDAVRLARENERMGKAGITQPPPPEHPLSSGDAIACIGMALQNPDTDEWPQLLRDCMHVIERMEGELLDAKRQRNDESRLRQAAERAGAQYTLRGWISPNPGCAELADHDGGGWEPVYSRSTKISEQP